LFLFFVSKEKVDGVSNVGDDDADIVCTVDISQSMEKLSTKPSPTFFGTCVSAAHAMGTLLLGYSFAFKIF
jgi:hypothetical protein